MTYRIVQSGARYYGVRNEETGQIDHDCFATKRLLRSWWNLHFAWREGYRLVD